MITMTMAHGIQDAKPEDVFYTLSDPEGLQALMPRLHKVEFYPQSDTSANVVMHISIGRMFGTIRCEGQLSWVEPQSLTFEVQTPLPVKNVWSFSPAPNGTHVDITMELDLVPLLGPMAAFVPTDVVVDMMKNELRHAMGEVAARVHQRGPANQAACAA